MMTSPNTEVKKLFSTGNVESNALKLHQIKLSHIFPISLYAEIWNIIDPSLYSLAQDPQEPQGT